MIRRGSEPAERTEVQVVVLSIRSMKRASRGAQSNSLPLLLLWTFLTAVGCGKPSPQPVLLFAAASTTDAVEDLSQIFQAKSGTRILTNFSSSSALAQQITYGAEASVFLSANVEWVEALEKEGLVANRVDLLGNRLVVIVAADSKLGVRTIEGLAALPFDHLALADPSAVPAGIYARQALINLGLWSALETKVVAGADVRQVLAYVERGAAEIGIVYLTDAAISVGTRVLLEVPVESHDLIIHPLVLLKVAQGSSDAQALYRYLQSAAAAAVFRRFGFTIQPPGGGSP